MRAEAFNRTIVLASSFLIALALISPLHAADEAVPNRVEIKLNGHTFTLPEGFTIELVAGNDLVERPITCDFDELGRLYVSESSGSNEKVEIQLEKKPHRILRLEDTNDDGVFDRRTVYADNMMLPEGTMWLDGSLYVAAPPSIWKLTDTDDDGIADKREEWHKGETLTGCANDLHGPYLGPDGWIYWTKGAFAKQQIPLHGKPDWSTRASHVFRKRPGGGEVQVVMTGGMDNPVDVVFMPNGDPIVSCTFLVHPEAGKRDGLIHAIYGGIYGKDHDPIHEHPWTSPKLMPVLSHMGPAAPCGLVRMESTAFGDDYRDNLFCCAFNMRKVTRHILTPKGGTYESQDSDFLVSDQLDFHPTDVQEDADGSLLVVDTGGWYKLCCPTSQFIKEDVLGGIYRVKKVGAKRHKYPRGSAITWPECSDKLLIKLMGDERFTVRKHAVQVVAARGEAILVELSNLLRAKQPKELKMNVLSVMAQMTSPIAHGLPVVALNDDSEAIRVQAVNVVGLYHDANVIAMLTPLLRKQPIASRRAAAEALARMGDKRVIKQLLLALAEPDVEANHELEHSLIFALIECGDAKATRIGLSNKSPVVRKASLVALDQMRPSSIEAKDVIAELSASHPPLVEIAFWIAGRHPEWGGELAAYLKQELENSEPPKEGEDALAQLVAKLCVSQEVAEMVGTQLADDSVSQERKRRLLRVLQLSAIKKTPASWSAALATLLATDLKADAVLAARRLAESSAPPPELAEALAKLIDSTEEPAQRLLALVAMRSEKLSDTAFALVAENIEQDEPVATRALAAEALARSKPTNNQAIRLCGLIDSTSPLEVESVIRSIAQVRDDEVGNNLVKALSANASEIRIPVGAIRQVVSGYSEEVRAGAEKLFEKLDAQSAEQRTRLTKLVDELPAGDVRRGQAVFHGAKAACISCHSIGYVGGKTGPDLTRIGAIRKRRDLLESVLFPSASFVQTYEPRTIVTRDGRVQTGLLRGESAEEVTLVVNATQSVKIPRGEIEEIQLGKTSIMPAGLDKQLSEQDLADLIAYLEACR